MKSNKMRNLTNREENIISTGEWLEDTHMDMFSCLIKTYCISSPQETWKLQRPEMINPVPQDVEHIQILYSGTSNYDGHWVCSYYDKKSIFIFDSLNKKKLHKDHVIFLKKLFPFYNVNNETVIFPTVQQQPNGNDCGVFAIAFATSLLYNIKPDKVFYDHAKMRVHLLSILKTHTIDHFPQDLIHGNQIKVLPLVQKNQRKNLSPKLIGMSALCDTIAKNDDLSALSDNIAKNTDLSALCDNFAKNKNLSALSDTIAKNDELSALSDNFAKNKNLSALSDNFAKNKDLSALSDKIVKNDKLSALSDNFAKNKNLSALSDKIAKNDGLSTLSDKTAKNDGLSAFSDDIEKEIVQQRINSIIDIEMKNEDQLSNKIDIKYYKNKIEIDKLCITRRQYYENNKDSLCAKRKKYREENRETICKNKRKKYEENKEKICTKKRKNYKNNKDKLNIMKRKKYEENKEKICAKRKRNYENNKDKLNIMKKKKYEEIKEKICNNNRKYYKENKENICINKKIYYKKNKKNMEQLLLSQKECKEYYERNKDLRTIKKNYFEEREKIVRIKQKILIAQNICTKYKMFRIQGNTIALQRDAESYVKKISKNLINETSVNGRIEAERILKWCYFVRQSYLFSMGKTLRSIREKAELHLTQLSVLACNDISSTRNVLCGKSKHIATSEAYYAETAYNNNMKDFKEPLILNEHGQITNVSSLQTEYKSIKKSTKSWVCNDFCNINDSAMLHRYQQILKVISECKWIKSIPKLFHRLGECTVKSTDMKEGHSHGCYIKPEICKSLLLAVNFLSPHFPRVRFIGRLINLLRYKYKKLKRLDESLENGDISVLKEIIKNVEDEANKQLLLNDEINLNEDNIMSKYSKAFEIFTKRSMDVPRFECISCERLHCRSDMTALANMRNQIICKYWDDLIVHVKKEEKKVDYICHYCIGHFRKNALPPLCVLNNLYVGKIPEIFSTLNDYEKILIQRAKAFQCVQRMGTVTNKKVPHKQMIQKIKGRIFHLPLPMEESFKKICPSNAAINLNHEIYILVRGIPTKSKIVWENLVNVKKIYEVLIWLKENNQYYSEIILPRSHTELLSEELNEIEYIFQDEKIDKRAAILTQITEPDSYYEHYTIYPMYEKRMNSTSTDLYQMLKVEAVPLDNRYKHLDVLCFPDLYPYGKNGLNEERQIHIRDFDFVKCRLISKHSHFRLNIQYIFFLLNNANMRQINSGIYHKLNIVNSRAKYTAAEFLKSMHGNELEGNLNTIFGKLPNTKQYWCKVRNDINAMTRDYGPATWFLTLSPAEWLWSDLGEYIKEVSPSLRSVNSISELVALDPVSAARFIQNKFLAILLFIRSPDNPIGKVKHYFIRCEYQNRGMPHWHLMIWIEDAPIIGQSSNEDVVNFITKYITCKIPNKRISPQLHRRVTTHQQHYHNSYCMRNKKTSNGFIRKCRFGFPRPIIDKIMLRDIAISIANRKQLKNKNRLYDLPRNNNEKNINDYNPTLLTAWEGNMDIQFIGEKSTLLNWYCTKYTTKSECSYGVDTFDIINSTKSLRSCLWNIALRSLSNRECGAIEAADLLLGIPLHSTDPNTTFRWLDVNEIRSRKIKTRKEIEELDSNSTDIFCQSFIDNYYPNRPKELETCNLYDFAKWYDISRNKITENSLTFYNCNNKLYLKKRKRGYLINHFTYNMNTQPEKYYYSLLLLFKPWRDLNELKGCCDTYAEAFATIKSEISMGLRYHERIEELQKAFDHVKELINQRITDDKCENKQSLSNDQMQCKPLEADGAMKELREVRNKIIDENITQMIKELNIDQKRIFDKVTNRINNFDSSNPLRFYVSGEGGTGKSFLIKTIRCWTKQIINKDTAVLAPTGIAAFNIDGLTVHRLLQLPVEHGSTPKYRPLSDAVLKTLRNELKDTVLFIIDEISMISNITLMYINLRLTEIFDTIETNDGWFGGKHILLFGDLLQLPPVREEPAFIKISGLKNEKYLGSLAASNLWSDLFIYDELTINMRQRGDETYREMLSRIRIGVLTDDDIRLLQSRKINFQSNDIDARLIEVCNYIQTLPLDAICILPTCHLCDILNAAMLKTINGEEVKLISRDILDCAEYFKKRVNKVLDQYEEDNSRTAGLNRLISLKIGAKVMLRRNIDVTLGLVNGTIGEIIGFSKAEEGTRWMRIVVEEMKEIKEKENKEGKKKKT